MRLGRQHRTLRVTQSCALVLAITATWSLSSAVTGVAFANVVNIVNNVIGDLDQEGVGVGIDGSTVAQGSATILPDSLAVDGAVSCPETGGIGCIVSGAILASIGYSDAIHLIWGGGHQAPVGGPALPNNSAISGFSVAADGSLYTFTQPTTLPSGVGSVGHYYDDSIGHVGVSANVTGSTCTNATAGGEITYSCNLDLYGGSTTITGLCETTVAVSTFAETVAADAGAAGSVCPTVTSPANDTHVLTDTTHCADGSAVSSASPSFTDSSTGPADIPFPHCPSGVKPTSITIGDSDTGSQAIPTATWTAPSSPTPAYLDCGPDGLYAPCILRYQEVTLPSSMTITATQAGIDWQDCTGGAVSCTTLSTHPTGAIEHDTDLTWGTSSDPTVGPGNDWYRCEWGPDNVPLGDCYDSGVARTGTASQPVTTPDETACFPNGWSAVEDPVSWVEDPVKCALKWAFVPSASSVTSITSSTTGLESKPPASVLIASGTGLAAVYSSFTGGCTHFPDFSPAQNGEGELPCAPADPSGGWTIAYNVMKVALVIGTLLAIWGMLLAGFGGSAAGGDDV